MADIDEVRSRDSMRRRISELTRQVGDEARVAEVSEEEYAARQALNRRRMSATMLVLAGAFFIAGWALLTATTYDGSAVCGTALSNPGWSDGSECYGQVTGFGWGGVAALVVSAGLAFAARFIRWPDLD